MKTSAGFDKLVAICAATYVVVGWHTYLLVDAIRGCSPASGIDLATSDLLMLFSLVTIAQWLPAAIIAAFAAGWLFRWPGWRAWLGLPVIVLVIIIAVSLSVPVGSNLGRCSV